MSIKRIACAALALSLGRMDGRHAVTREEHLNHARLLGQISGLPVNGDLEDGFGPAPSAVSTRAFDSA